MTARDDRRGRTRTYGDSCGIARALDLVGDRWALLIARELLLGPKRFTDLRSGLPNVGPDVLASRLRELEATRVVSRRRLPPPASAKVYQLTDWGRELEPVLHSLGRWGSRAPFPAEPPALGPDALAVALQTTFAPERTGRMSRSFELWLGEHVFSLIVAPGRLDLRRGIPALPEVTIHADTATLGAILWHGRSLPDAMAAGAIRIDGDRDAAVELFGLFPAPAPAPVPAAA